MVEGRLNDRPFFWGLQVLSPTTDTDQLRFVWAAGGFVGESRVEHLGSFFVCADAR